MTPIPSRPSDDKSHRVVLEDTTVQWVAQGPNGTRIYERTIPEGFRFRLGVSLRMGLVGLLDLVAPTYALESAIALHDYLYYEKEERPEEAVPRHVADAAMHADPNDPTWVQWASWAVVRAVGWTVW